MSITFCFNPFYDYSYNTVSYFSIDEPDLNEITSLNGNNNLAASTDRSVSWLIMPLMKGALMFDIKYEVTNLLDKIE